MRELTVRAMLHGAALGRPGRRWRWPRSWPRRSTTRRSRAWSADLRIRRARGSADDDQLGVHAGGVVTRTVADQLVSARGQGERRPSRSDPGTMPSPVPAAHDGRGLTERGRSRRRPGPRRPHAARSRGLRGPAAGPPARGSAHPGWSRRMSPDLRKRAPAKATSIIRPCLIRPASGRDIRPSHPVSAIAPTRAAWPTHVHQRPRYDRAACRRRRRSGARADPWPIRWCIPSPVRSPPGQQHAEGQEREQSPEETEAAIRGRRDRLMGPSAAGAGSGLGRGGGPGSARVRRPGDHLARRPRWVPEM